MILLYFFLFLSFCRFLTNKRVHYHDGTSLWLYIDINLTVT